MGSRAQPRGAVALVALVALVPLVALLVAATTVLGAASPAAAQSTRDRAPARQGMIDLGCSVSVGQQGAHGERVVNGVAGLWRLATGGPTALSPISGPGGRRWYVDKALLAVSTKDVPSATVTVSKPKLAKLVYGPAADQYGPGLVVAARRSVRIAVCGPGFSGYVGGVVVSKPACVTFTVSTRKGTSTVTVPVGLRRCPRAGGTRRVP